MGIKKFKPTTPGRRGMTVTDYSVLSDVAPERIVDTVGFADVRGRGTDVFDLAAEHEPLDPGFDFVVELVAVVTEEFDPVVLVGIVGCGEDDPRIGAKGARDVGDAGRGKRADDKHINTERGESGHHGILQHVAREAGVFSQHDLAAAAGMVHGPAESGEDMGGGAAELEGGFGGDGLDVGDPADSVSSE